MKGERIGRYVVVESLGAGAMGVVWRAHDPELDRPVAIKVVRPQVLDPERHEAARARLLAEARALARISHPNIVAVFEVGLHEGDVFVAMELVDGVDLERWLAQRVRTIDEIVAVFAAVARGLAEVHAVGIVHRDIKPPNLLIGHDGAVKVGDFGIARTTIEAPRVQVDSSGDLVVDLDHDTTALTAEGRVVGTPAYMAPEQHLGEAVGPATDQYGLAVALYEAIWGERPFRASGRRLLEAKRRGPAFGKDRHVPPWLMTIVRRGLAYEVADRFATMTQMADALAKGGSSRGRRRLAWAAAGATLLVVGAIAAQTFVRPEVCTHDDEALGDAWDAASRRAVEEAFEASARPWAKASWIHVAASLDGYAEGWRAMHRDTCLATAARREQSEDVLDRRMACLQTRRRALAATSRLLATGDDAVIDRALDLVARLRPVATCSADRLMGTVVVSTVDLRRLALGEGVRSELARGRALLEAGRFVDAATLAEQALTTARDLDDPALFAEAVAFVGRTTLRVGPIEDAKASLESALWAAVAIDHDEVAADAATDLVWIAGQFDRSLVDALRWAELARTSISRAGDHDRFALVQLDNAIGAAQQHAAHYDEATASFESAIARIADDPTATGPRANARHNLAKAALDRGDLAAARATLEPAIAELAGVVGDDHPRVVAMRGTLAQVFGASGDHARAVALFTAEVAGLRVAMGDDALAVAHARTNLGVSLGRLGRVEEAIAVTELALAAFERAGDDGGAATCLGNIADDLLEHGIHDAAATRFEQAARLLERMFPEGHPDLVYPLIGLGRVRMAQRRFVDALALVERADALVARLEGSSGHLRGLALAARGDALIALGRDADAIAVLDEQVDVLRTAGDAMHDELPTALLQRAEQHHRMQHGELALRDADEALALARARDLADMVVRAGQVREAVRGEPG